LGSSLMLANGNTTREGLSGNRRDDVSLMGTALLQK
jgi:hypothetical protein